MTTSDGESSIYPLTWTTPHIGEKVVRDGRTKEFYLLLTSTLFLKRKQQKLYVTVDFNNIWTKDSLVDSGAYVSAIAQNQ